MTFEPAPGATYGVGVEDTALLRRLQMRRCVYGVDISGDGLGDCEDFAVARFVCAGPIALVPRPQRLRRELSHRRRECRAWLMEGDSSFAAMLLCWTRSSQPRRRLPNN